jgi:oxygen-dependent protoporphyrinogen oxidase
MRAAASSEVPLPPFYSLKGGLESLIEALKRQLASVSMQLLTPVEAIEGAEDDGVVLRFARREPLRADGVVVALPPPQAARLLASTDAETAEQLGAMGYSTATIVTMWFRGADVARIPPGGSGFLVPSRARRTVAACTWWSRKWPIAQSGSDDEILRCFIARREEPEDDGRVIDRALTDLERIIGVSKWPFESIVTRWDPALPVLEVGHLERASRIRNSMRAHPRIVLAGVPERGSGITECVRRGTAAAEQIVGPSISAAR